MRVLHITGWYPSPSNPKEAIWIKRHIEALAPFVDYSIIHTQVKPSRRFSFQHRIIAHGHQQILSLPSNSWFIIEIISSLLLLFVLTKTRANKNFDIINFHIGYPNLTYWHIIKKFVRVPIVITEHWSAYHFNFGVKKSLPRIQRIFQQHIPVITVSKALYEDIKQFSKSEFPNFVIPNIVNTDLFYPNTSLKRKPFFFMVSQWNTPKKPFIAMEAFLQFNKRQNKFKLYIGGYGNLWDEMECWIKEQKVSNIIKLVGKLESKEVASYLQSCTAFIHPSNYESFSVVCAESVSCHTPVIASRVGGIQEVVLKNEGILVESFDINEWVKAFEASLTKTFLFDKQNLPSESSIGDRYFQVLSEILS